MSRAAKFPRVREISVSPICSFCSERSIVTATVQRSPYRKSHDVQIHLCASCYRQTGARELPVKDKHASTIGRGEALLAAWIEAQS